MNTPLWSPSAARVEQANLTRFLAYIRAEVGVDLSGFEALHAWSIADQGAFHSAFWDFAGIIGEKGEITYRTGAHMKDAQYFPAGQLSYAENLLAGKSKGGELAVLLDREDGAHKSYTWADLYDLTARYRAMFDDAGVVKGDRIAAMVPNCLDSIAILLAANSVGAITATCSPDFGIDGAVDRFGQIEPKVFISCNGYVYGGKRHHIRDKALEILRQLPDNPVHSEFDFLDFAPHDLPAPAELTFAALAFDHPLSILFSSGTTGKPKCIVHRQGGELIKHLIEHVIHADGKPGDRTFFFTTCGWMMWNWLITGLANGQTIQLFDGSPFAPGPEILWEMAARNQLSYFGCGAKYIDSLAKSGYKPGESVDLASLRTLATTGSTLIHESFDFVYDGIKSDVCLSSISGGTDIVGCFVGGLPTRPVYRGEIQAPILGMDVQIYDDAATRVNQGQRGELVCAAPFPTMPLEFWQDPGDVKYMAAYYDHFPGVWHHGDFIEESSANGYIIHGRSDATLNPGGVRIGTAEIYRQVETLPEIQEAVVVGQPHEGDTRVVLFLIMKPDHCLNDDLRQTLRARIRKGASPRHVPAVIAQVADIPKTRSGKISELAVRDVISGIAIKNAGALSNPEALDLFLPALERV